MIRFVPETGSTSADLAERLRAGDYISEGDWLVADHQTAGRGRQGRVWTDGAGNFMGSTVVHLRAGDPLPPTLALSVGLAVHEAVSQLGVPAMLKWPNDVLVGTAKLVGILLERVADSIVIGIGVNLAQAPALPDRDTVSLAELGVHVDRDTFAGSLARTFDEELERWRNFGLGPIVSRWTAAAHSPGTLLRVGSPGESTIEGEFAGLTQDGALQLRLPDGTTRIVNAGDVRVAGE